MLPNVPPKLFTLSAVAVGYILLDDATANEQNALGNWLMLVAQLLCTNAFYRQVREERRLETNKAKQNKYQRRNNRNVRKTSKSHRKRIKNNKKRNVNK